MRTRTLRHVHSALESALALALCGGTSLGDGPAWQPAPDALLTRWAADVRADRVHPEYPRPQMVRGPWVNLNGLWDHAVRPASEGPPKTFDGAILVPFPIESALSGVRRMVGPDERIWYRRTFATPALAPRGRLLLHFGAVDWQMEAWVDGNKVGAHSGGYDPFTFDITGAMGDGNEHDLLVSAADPTDAGTQPRGKQVRKPEGIWYTAVSGIWQTVWLEPIPEVSIDRLILVPDVDGGALHVTAHLRGGGSDVTIQADATAGGAPARAAGSARGKPGERLTIKIDGARLWSPSDPFLYDLTIRLQRGERVVDEVQSYFGMRTIALARDQSGHLRLALNGRPLFQLGLLDQGWWPDGLYLAPTDEALRSDVEAAQSMGFNLLRKHVKVEPAVFYSHCDRLGMLVWQDMPSGDAFIGPGDADVPRAEESAQTFRREYRAMIESLHNHPCIVMWVPFNEGWGQFDTAGVVELTRSLDPTRLVNAASGWTDRGIGDVLDIHSYPSPALPAPQRERAAVLGEFGGLGWPVSGHLWEENRGWGYATYKSAADLEEAYRDLIAQLPPLIAGGLAAAVYTQLTDVESEVNGLLTYDRHLFKVAPETMRAINAAPYQPAPTLRTLVETSEQAGQEWSYTTTAPPPGWHEPAFDDSAWIMAPGGFGTGGTPGAIVRTTWSTTDIWLRRTVTLERPAGGALWLRTHHDEDAEIYVNGTPIASMRGYTTAYVLRASRHEAARVLRRGANVIAVHCRQSAGGQFIDVGLMVAERPRD